MKLVYPPKLHPLENEHYRNTSRAEMHAVFLRAKEYLHTAEKGFEAFKGFSDNWICTCVEYASRQIYGSRCDNLMNTTPESTRVDRACRAVIECRLQSATFLPQWMILHNLPLHDGTLRVHNQTMRHAWLDQLIEEFSR